MRIGRAGRTWAVVGLAVVIGVAALARSRGRPAAERPLLLGASTMTVALGIHMLGGLGPSPAYAVETSRGLVLVDSGLEPDARPVKEQLAALGLDWTGLRAIFLTHVHGDHTGGAEHLRKATGAKVHAGKGDAEVLRAGASREAFFSTFHMPNHSPHPTDVDVELVGGETFDFGNLRIRAIAAPGHTPGSVCYLLERADLRAIFGGDVLMHSGERASVGAYTAELPPIYRGDAEDFVASLRKLRELPAPDLLLPGHPRLSPPQSPRLTPAKWAGLIDDGIRGLSLVASCLRADGADFLDGHPKRLLPDLYYLGDREGVAVYAVFLASKLFVVNAPGGPGLAGFVAEGLRRLDAPEAAPDTVLLTSCDEAMTSGLPDLIRETGCSVMAPALAVADLRRACPPSAVVVAAEGRPSRDFPITFISQDGRDRPAMAYSIPVAGKAVMFTGKIPILFDRDSVERLRADIAGSEDASRAFLGSIDSLADIRPDLWLPARPSQGQNANLYGNMWNNIIANNRRPGYNRGTGTAAR